MCGRYALALPPWRIRQQLDEWSMPSQDAPEDDDIRQSYNFTPGYYGLVYRADVPDHGAGSTSQRHHRSEADSEPNSDEVDVSGKDEENSEVTLTQRNEANAAASKEPQYKLQAMKWGLIPFWTKRNPDYGTLMKTINCRDDSLAAPGGMWHTMKQGKRCVVIAQGFFEWLKKNEGKDKIPHYIKRKDGQLMCFAGLWDCAKYEGAEEKTYTYTIITTDANKQISFLHDRMPVILDNGSDGVFTWLDSKRSEWNKELQDLLKPFTGELEIYPVTKDMNKPGTSSPNYIIPINSAENKQNIANFFASPKKAAKTDDKNLRNKKDATNRDQVSGLSQEDTSIKQVDEGTDINSESNAPPPITGAKRKLEDEVEEPEHAENETSSNSASPSISQKRETKRMSPTKGSGPISSKRSKSATSNASVAKVVPTKSGDGNKRITSFFGK